MGLRDTTKSQNRRELFQGKTDQVTMEISLKKLSYKNSHDTQYVVKREYVYKFQILLYIFAVQVMEMFFM